MLKLLAMLFAWRAEISTCTNVDFLQTLAVAQSSMRDTVKSLSPLQLQSPLNAVVSPWEGKYLCKYFHIHSETTACHKFTQLKERAELSAANYVSRETELLPGQGPTHVDGFKFSRHERWVFTLDWHFQRQMEDLRRRLETEDDDNAEGTDEPSRKRQRPS